MQQPTLQALRDRAHMETKTYACHYTNPDENSGAGQLSVRGSNNIPSGF